MAALVLAAAASAAAADMVRTRAGIGYTGTIVGLDAEGLVIEFGGGRRSVPLGDIDQIKVEKYPDLERAEAHYAKGLQGGAAAKAEFDAAERQYDALLKRGVPSWLRVLIQSRTYKLYAESGRSTQAVDAYLELARGHPKLVTGLALPRPRAGADAENQALLAKVRQAVAEAGDKPYAQELQKLHLLLTMEVGTPEEVLPLVRRQLASDNEATRRWARLKELDLLLALGRLDEADSRLADAARELGADYAAPLAFFRGRLFAERKLWVDAALEFMRLPVLYPSKDRGLTADALWRAGQAMEAAKLPRAEVVKVYEEAVRDYAGTTGAERARRELIRLQPR